MSIPSVFPTGVTVYDPEQCWNGFTLFQARGLGAMLIDMNGREVHLWRGVIGMPNKLLPGGHLLTGMADRYRHPSQGMEKTIQVDWNGNVEWTFDRGNKVSYDSSEPRYMSRQHHDLQREGNPVGYYAPEMEPRIKGNTLILAHKNVSDPRISASTLQDDWVYEVDAEGNIIWEWTCSEHLEELGFDDAAMAAIRSVDSALFDWMHINSMSVLGPNRWYEAGDERFHPDNIIMDSRSSNVIFIVEKTSGRIVWRVGPDYGRGRSAKLGWIIGPHNAHMIPRGLPGEGNILVFDNGGEGGYGLPNPAAPDGVCNARRAWSRVLEFDPVSLDILWCYEAPGRGNSGYRFYSPFVSNAQRLPNGNTLIDSGIDGIIREVTAEGKTVWEFVSPYYSEGEFVPVLGPGLGNMIYRAYRVPYDWAPQAEPGDQTPVHRMGRTNYRVDGAAGLGGAEAVDVFI